MAVTPIYELDVPDPHAGYFLHGEKALSVAATIGGAAGRTNYHLALWAYLEGGEYLIRVMAENASSWATSVTQDNPRVFFYTKRGAGPHEATIFMPRGLQRIDLILSTLATVAGPGYIAFSLHRQGRLVYSSNGTGWVFNIDEVILDDEVPNKPDVRSTMAVWSILPNWDQGIIERIAYETEILTSESEAEQRRSLRQVPRRTFEASFLRSNDRRTRLDSLIAGIGKNQLLVPMWHEGYRLQSSLSTDTLTLPTGELQFREFRAGMYCMLNAKNPNVYEVVQIDTIDLGTDTVTFVDPPIDTWPAGSRIWPMRVARILDESTIQGKTDAVGVTTVRFQADDAETFWFDPSWGNIDKLFTFKPNWISDVTSAVDRPTAHLNENAYGPIDVCDPEQRSRATMRGALQFKGHARLQAFRQFVDMARGRAVSFWIPSFMTDFLLTALPDGDEITIKSVGFVDYFKTYQPFRSAVVFEFKDGSEPIFRFIENATTIDTATERLTLSDTVSIGALGDVRRVSYLMLVRFDQDSFEFEHKVDDSAAVVTSFLVKSTNESVPLPNLSVRSVLTSLLYPLEIIEEMNVGGTLLSGHMWDDVGSLDVTAILLGGAIEVMIAYKTITADPEGFDVTATLLGGAIEVMITYEEITADPEGFDVAATLLGGEIETMINYIVYEDPASDEGINVGATLLGGIID